MENVEKTLQCIVPSGTILLNTSSGDLQLIYKSPQITAKAENHQVIFVKQTWSWGQVREFAMQVKFMQFETKKRSKNVEVFQAIFKVATIVEELLLLLLTYI